VRCVSNDINSTIHSNYEPIMSTYLPNVGPLYMYLNQASVPK